MAELLLRLFHSSYFTPHLAITYLKTYWDSVGITHYLVRALERAFSWEQVQVYWPQLCHLLISRPGGPSAALEHFILARCGDSIHTALITLWFFQAARADWSNDSTSPALHVSRRVINYCQYILFDANAPPQAVPRAVDEISTAVSPPPEASYASPWAAWAAPFRRRLTASADEPEEARIHPAHALTTLVGMSAMAASAPGQPAIMTAAGPMIILEGCKPAPADFDRLLRRTADEEPSDDEGDDASFSGSSSASDEEQEQEQDQAQEQEQGDEHPPPVPAKSNALPLLSSSAPSPDASSMPLGDTSSRSQSVPSPTSPAFTAVDTPVLDRPTDSPAPLAHHDEPKPSLEDDAHQQTEPVPFPSSSHDDSSVLTHNSTNSWTQTIASSSWGSWGASLWSSSTSEKFAELKDRAAGVLAAGISQVQIVPPPGSAPSALGQRGFSENHSQPQRKKSHHSHHPHHPHHHHAHHHHHPKLSPGSASPALVHQAGPNRLKPLTQGPYGYTYASSGPEGFGNTPPTLLARAASTARTLAYTPLIQPPPGTVTESPKAPGTIPGAGYARPSYGNGMRSMAAFPQSSGVNGSSSARPPPASLNLGHFGRGGSSHSTPNLARGSSVPNLLSRQVPSSSSGSLIRAPGRRVSGASIASIGGGAPDPLHSLGSDISYEERVALLRSHYARTQTDFLSRLESISGRLLLLPKPARVSALRAELTEINHMLPVEACLPLWCSATSDRLGRHKHHDYPLGFDPAAAASHQAASANKQERHHRIVRINPSEAVVLNSADRAPYVLQIEVLRNDLDFSPDRRANRDTLRRLLTKEAQLRAVRAPHHEGPTNQSASVEGSSHTSPSVMRAHRTSSDAVIRPRNLSNTSRAGSHTRLDLPSSGVKTTAQPTTMEQSLPSANRPVTPPAPHMNLPATPEAGLSRSASQSASSSKKDRPPLGKKAHTEIGLSPRSAASELMATEGGAEAQAHTGERPPDESFVSEVESAENEQRVGDMLFVDDPPEAEGVDMTEQAYGSHLERFGGRARDSAESRSSGSELDDGMDAVHVTFASGSSRNRSHDTAIWRGSRGSHQARSVDGKDERDFSLSDYSERMRTAAIMLAQLNQNRAKKGWVVTAPLGAAASGAASLVGVGSSGNSVPPAASEQGQGTSKVVSKWFPSWGQGAQPSTSATNPASAGVTAAGGGAVSSSSSAARVIPADAEVIRARIMAEMISLEEERMARLRGPVSSRKASKKFTSPDEADGEEEDAATIRAAVNKDDPSAAIFRESWAAKRERLRAASPYGAHVHWDVISVIIKTGADLRQEQLATQLVGEFSRIWQGEASSVWVRYFNILVLSESSGLMETITDAVSVHSIKKEAYSQASNEDGSGSEPIRTYSLWDHYTQVYGPPSSGRFKRAQDAFMRSLAGYSIICYLLQIKDRHNGNILVDHEGHLIRTLLNPSYQCS